MTLDVENYANAIWGAYTTIEGHQDERPDWVDGAALAVAMLVEEDQRTGPLKLAPRTTVGIVDHNDHVLPPALQRATWIGYGEVILALGNDLYKVEVPYSPEDRSCDERIQVQLHRDQLTVTS